MSLRLNTFIKAILSQPPRIILQKIARLLQRQWQSMILDKLDLFYSTHTQSSPQSTGSLNTFINKIPTEVLITNKEQTLSLADLYLNHTFDLLGSGWLQVRHGMYCPGLDDYRYFSGESVKADSRGNWLNRKINSSNKSYSKKIWRMVSPNYVPIDWQLDFKSGYRWKEKKQSSHCSPAPLPGVDIKVPWELSRMQHLPQLAWAYGINKGGIKETHPPETYVHEFRNQILDFIATNPPRFGVNWHCTMDVGIRVSNWLITYDLFKALGASFDLEFETAFQNSIYDHGRHIIENLEWNPTLRSNHYLANIAGLLFVSAYLPRSTEADTWLAFSIQELIHAMEEQFYPDGSNFEASTCYHRLSGEMMLYATALILGLPENKREALQQYQTIKPFPGLKLQEAPLAFFKIAGLDQTSPLPQTHFEKLEKIAHFTRSTTKPNGQAIQMGDNDSGRFLKLFPKFREIESNEALSLYQNLKNYQKPETVIRYWVENHLDFSHLTQAIDALFRKPADSSITNNIEAQVVIELANRAILPLFNAQHLNSHPTFHTDTSWDEACKILENFPSEQINTCEILNHEHSLKSGLKHHCFPEFGLYLIVSHTMFLAIRCGPVGQKGNGGHAHNDALSIELQINGIDRITDPGSYLYTPLPKTRNAYRSVKAHFAPYLESQEPNPIGDTLFQMEDRAQAQCLYFGEKGFIGMHRGYGSPVYRLIQVEEEKIIIKDGIDGPEKLISPDPTNPNHRLPFSSGYGIRFY